jgi:hypothetical protein
MQSDYLESEIPNPVSTNAPSPGELEIVRLQLQQALDTYRTQMTLLVQISTVMVIADCTVLGYSLANKSPAALVVAGVFPLFIRYIIEIVGRLSIPILYSAVNIEQRYGVRGVDSLAATFLSFTSSPEYVQKLCNIASTSGPNGFMERVSQLRVLPRPRLGGGGHLVTRGLMVIALGQIGAGLILHFAFGWPMLGNR